MQFINSCSNFVLFLEHNNLFFFVEVELKYNALSKHVSDNFVVSNLFVKKNNNQDKNSILANMCDVKS